MQLQMWNPEEAGKAVNILLVKARQNNGQETLSEVWKNGTEISNMGKIATHVIKQQNNMQNYCL